MDFARALVAKAQATIEASARSALRPAGDGGAPFSLHSPSEAAPQPDVPATTRRKMPVAAHSGFAPALGVWGAACGALCVAVLPGWMIPAIALEILPQFAAAWARPTLMIGAATIMGLVCYAAALAVHRLLQRRQRSAAVRPIDPARELGSASFDAPLSHPAPPADMPADLPTSEEPGIDWQASAFIHHVDDDAYHDGVDDLAVDLGNGVAGRTPPERELDLAEFAALPGRNAVWVDEAPQAVAEPPAAPAAIEKLRAVPPAQLSLCEMVERFAAALQDYQAADDADPAGQSQQQREAVLSEALKALALVAGDGAVAAQTRRNRSDAA